MIAVIHLVRKANGIATFKRFINSYLANRPQIEHVLYLCFKGFNGAVPAEYLDAAEGANFLTFHRPDRFNALHTLRTCVEKLHDSFTHIVWLNSFSEILRPNWLERLVFAIHGKAGMVSCTGSNESMRNRLLYYKYPNPHVRTNAFIITRALFLPYWSPHIYIKAQAHAFESGKNSISNRLTRDGYFVGVVSTEGVYGLTCLDTARTFREPDQRKYLLIADNQTRYFEEADTATQEMLYKMAWNI